jgi:O-antigen ligase
MTWADVSWTERLAGMKPFHKLLVLPLLALHFSQSRSARFAAYAFLFSTTLLLLYSWLSWEWPSLTFAGRAPGVPVKDYIYQGIAFVIAICGFLYLGLMAFWAKRHVATALCAVVVMLFLANFAFVAASRTALLLLPALLALLGLRLLGIRAAIAFLAIFLLVGSLGWALSPALQLRMRPLLTLIVDQSWPKAKSENERRYLWSQSIRIIATAPLIGHGTGTNRALFERAGPNPFPGFALANPHNQTFWIALQLGAAGTALLYLMWFSHLLWFRGPGWAATMGGIIVAQNILASTVNSHLADFTAGWLYILGVGILGGAVLRSPILTRQRLPPTGAAQEPSSRSASATALNR